MGYLLGVDTGGTYTDAEISRDRINPANQGNKPRRQADFIYQLSGQYEQDMFTGGANMVGTTDSYAQDNNLLDSQQQILTAQQAGADTVSQCRLDVVNRAAVKLRAEAE